MRLFFLTLFVVTIISSGLLAGSPPIVPNPKLTPGDVLPVSKEDICVVGYTKLVRDVPEKVKKQVYRMYGITHHAPHEYEVDHLISLELGGSNSPKNLWPESYLTAPWNARTKDALENRLHSMVCKGEIDLTKAQQEIAKDWIAAYKKYIGPEPKAAETPSARTTPAPSSAEVWVNTRSGIYFKAGDRYYGRTKEGKYMSESDARSKGFHAAKE
jgi:hypothetical protein